MSNLGIVLVIALVTSLPTGVLCAQATKSVDVPFTAAAENLERDVPRYVLGQVVFQTLREFVRPGLWAKQVIIAADGLDWSWIPYVENVEFRIVPWDERKSLACQGVKEYVYFRRFESTRRGYKLAVATTDGCSDSGQTYSFHWRNGTLVRDRGWELFGSSRCPCRPGCADDATQPN